MVIYLNRNCNLSMLNLDQTKILLSLFIITLLWTQVPQYYFEDFF